MMPCCTSQLVSAGLATTCKISVTDGTRASFLASRNVVSRPLIVYVGLADLSYQGPFLPPKEGAPLRRGGSEGNFVTDNPARRFVGLLCGHRIGEGVVSARRTLL